MSVARARAAPGPLRERAGRAGPAMAMLQRLDPGGPGLPAGRLPWLGPPPPPPLALGSALGADAEDQGASALKSSVRRPQTFAVSRRRFPVPLSGLQRTQVEGPVTGALRCSHTTPTLSLPSGTWSAEGPGLEALLPPQVQASVSSPHGEWPAGPAPAHRTVSSAPRRALGSCPCTALERVMSSQYWLLPKQGPCVK